MKKVPSGGVVVAAANTAKKPAANQNALTLKKCLDFHHRWLLEENLANIDRNGCREIVLDISSLKWINVFTISALLKLHEKLRRDGKNLRVVGCGKEVYGALAYLGLDKLIRLEKG
jgi:anti-anti-sigma factor